MWIVATVVAFAVVAFCVWSAKSGLAAAAVLLVPGLLLYRYASAGVVGPGEAAAALAVAGLTAVLVLRDECEDLRADLWESDRKVEELEKLLPPRSKAPRKKGWDDGQD